MLAAEAAPDDGSSILFAVFKLRASVVNPKAASTADVGVSTHPVAADAAWVLGGTRIEFDPRSEEERLDRLRSARVAGSRQELAPAVRARRAAAGEAACLRQKGDARATLRTEGL